MFPRDKRDIGIIRFTRRDEYLGKSIPLELISRFLRKLWAVRDPDVSMLQVVERILIRNRFRVILLFRGQRVMPTSRGRIGVVFGMLGVHLDMVAALCLIKYALVRSLWTGFFYPFHDSPSCKTDKYNHDDGPNDFFHADTITNRLLFCDFLTIFVGGGATYP